MRPAVWAPAPAVVEFEVAGGRIPASAAGGGWYEAAAEIEPGADYAVVLDGAAVPDPRSRSQPGGVHGRSRAIVPGLGTSGRVPFRPGPLGAQVFYELHVGTFTAEGTFDAATAKLDHLVDLGVSAVELMPVAEFPGDRGWGYDGVDLYAPHHAYGGPDGLVRLVDACHRKGLAVVLDVVYNHLGPDGNYLGRFGPYFSSAYRTPWGDAVNLDGPGSDEVRSFFIDNACMWLADYGFDGLRLDAVHAIFDRSAHHFLEELSERISALGARLGRHLWLIAESDLNDPRIVRPRAAGGYGIDAQWSDDFHHALHAAMTGERSGYYRDFGSVGAIAKALQSGFVYDGIRSEHRDRRHGRPAGDLSGHSLLGYLQNHDQIGNRARGERTSALLTRDLLEVGAALVLTAPFVPMLFQGEEWGASTPWMYFTDHRDPGLAAAVSRGRIEEFAAFGWRPEDVPDPQDPATFERSKLRWDEIERGDHAELLEWHRALIQARRSLEDLGDGRMRAVRARFDDDGGWLAYERGAVTVACNLSGVSAEVVLRRRPGEIVLASKPPERSSPGGVVLAPESVTAWSR